MSDKSNKHQGESAGHNELSDDRQERKPEHLDRGLGSQFANSVAQLMDEAKSVKGSTHGFLGHEKQTIDTKQFAHSLNKPEDKK